MRTKWIPSTRFAGLFEERLAEREIEDLEPSELNSTASCPCA